MAPSRRNRRTAAVAKRLTDKILKKESSILKSGAIPLSLGKKKLTLKNLRRKTPSNRNRSNEYPGSAGTLSNYIRTVTNPFNCPPVRLGWGCFTPTSLHTAFSKANYVAAPTSTCFCVMFVPSFWAQGALVTGAFTRSFEDAASSGVITGSTGAHYTDPANTVYLDSAVYQQRTVSAGLRVTVKYAATAVRGNLYAVNVGSQLASNVLLKKYDEIMQLYQARSAEGATSGEIGIEVQYRPSDPTDFQFLNLSRATTNSSSTVLVVGTGWPAGAFNYSIEAVAHGEAVSGIDASGDDETSSLATNSITQESAAQSLAPFTPVIPSITEIEMLDAAVQNIDRSSVRTGMGRSGLRPMTGLHITSNVDSIGSMGTGMANPLALSSSSSSSALAPIGVSASSPPIPREVDRTSFRQESFYMIPASVVPPPPQSR